MKKHLFFIGFLALMLISTNFFDAQFLDKRLVNYFVFLTAVTLTLVSLPFFLTARGGGIILPVQIIVFSILLSIPMTYLVWGQSILDSIIETHQYVYWIFFFFLLHLKPPIRIIENVVLLMGGLYVVLYFYQLMNYQTVLFGNPTWGEFLVIRGAIRIMFPAAGPFVLAVFICLCRFTSGEKYKWLYLAFIILGVLIPILQVTRLFIVSMAFLIFFHFIRKRDIFQKGLFALFFFMLVVAAIMSDNPLIRGMLESGKEDLSSGSDYIRVLAAQYFMTDLSPNFMAAIFGNGAPNWGISSYGKVLEKLALYQEYYLSDVGIVAMYAMFGIPAIMGVVFMAVRIFSMALPKEHYYLHYYFAFLMINSLTTSAIYHHHYLMATVYALFIFQITYQGIIKVIDPKTNKSVKLFVERMA